nr:hypothetical protein [Mammaliicoccus sp. Marseille-Q6498]
MLKFFKKNRQKASETIEDKTIVEINGMTIVDAYYVQNDQVEKYIKDRERYSDALIYVLKQHYESVERLFEGTDDGEAIVAFQNEAPVKCIYLNPETIDRLRELETTLTLKQSIIEICELNNES